MTTLKNVENELIEQSDYNLPLVRDLGDLQEQPPEVSPNNPPWSSPMAFLVWFLSVLAIIVFPAIFLLPYLISNRDVSAANVTENPTAIILNLIAVLPAHLATLAVAWFVASHYRQFSLDQTLGLQSGGVKWWHYPVFLAGFLGLALAVGYLFPEGDNDMLRMLRSSRVAVFIVAILATVTAPVVEEVVYRGLLYSAFQRTIGVPAAVALVTFLFALVHLPQYWGSPGTIILVCLLSLMLTLIRVKSDNLLPCIIMHAIFNGLQSLALVTGVAELK